MYAATAKAPPGVKVGFVDDLQSTLGALPAGDIVLVLGDFNARVEKRESGDDVWREVRGLHGIALVMKLENSSLKCALLTI